MSENVKLYTGRVISAKQFNAQRQTETDAVVARETAVDILAQAEARAQEIIDAANVRADEIEASVKQIADDQLIRYVDVNAIDKVALSLQSLITSSANIRADFEAFSPWMHSFINDTVTRIIGAMPDDEMWAGMIRLGMSDIQDRWNLVLRVHPSHAGMIKDVIETDPLLAAAFKDVLPDRTLDLKECMIEGAQGVTDISLKTQLTAVLSALELSVEQHMSDTETDTDL